MCPSAPRVCSEPGGQKPELSLSLDLIQKLYLFLCRQALYVTLVEGDLQLSSNTIPVVLERARLLFNIPQFKAQIRR